MKDMFSSKLFIPIVILLASAIISVVVIILSNNKKKKKKTVEPANEPTYTNSLPQVPTNDVVQEIKEEPTVVEQAPLPVVDIPVPSTDDTSFQIEPIKQLTNENMNEAITVEKTIPAVENDINPNEIVEVERFKQLTNEPEQSVQVEKTTQLDESNVEQDEIVQLTFPKPVSDVGEAAFKSIPTNNTTINTDIKVEEPHEYDGNKTEIFNLEDIQEALNKE